MPRSSRAPSVRTAASVVRELLGVSSLQGSAPRRRRRGRRRRGGSRRPAGRTRAPRRTSAASRRRRGAARRRSRPPRTARRDRPRTRAARSARRAAKSSESAPRPRSAARPRAGHRGGQHLVGQEVQRALGFGGHAKSATKRTLRSPAVLRARALSPPRRRRSGRAARARRARAGARLHVACGYHPGLAEAPRGCAARTGASSRSRRRRRPSQQRAGMRTRGCARCRSPGAGARVASRARRRSARRRSTRAAGRAASSLRRRRSARARRRARSRAAPRAPAPARRRRAGRRRGTGSTGCRPRLASRRVLAAGLRPPRALIDEVHGPVAASARRSRRCACAAAVRASGCTMATSEVRLMAELCSATSISATPRVPGVDRPRAASADPARRARRPRAASRGARRVASAVGAVDVAVEPGKGGQRRGDHRQPGSEVLVDLHREDARGELVDRVGDDRGLGAAQHVGQLPVGAPADAGGCWARRRSSETSVDGSPSADRSDEHDVPVGSLPGERRRAGRCRAWWPRSRR